MKSCTFLIILLGFIRVSFCFLPLNVTEENVCPVTWFRRKRADVEYTRWRSNVETTAEFIVKVLDDDVSAATTKLAAINIQPVTHTERIIVGGAILPIRPSPSTEIPKEYTRFIPPTAGKTGSEETGQPFLVTESPSFRQAFAQIVHDPPVNRDDSPPGSPQFLPRTPAHPTRQYAPIAPVAFTRQTTGTPLTPPYNYNQHPTRSQSPLTPTRTLGLLDKLEKLEDFPIFDAQIPDDGGPIVITRTTLKQELVRIPTYTKSENINEELGHYFSQSTIRDQGGTLPMFTENPLEAFTEFEEKEFTPSRVSTEEEKDIHYNNMFFYNTDYKDSNSTINELTANYKTETDDKQYIENASIPELRTKNVDNIPSMANMEEDYTLEVENKTGNLKHPQNSMKSASANQALAKVRDVPKILARVAGDVMSRGKRYPECNLIKLRPLSFNTPRTLPEIVDQLKKWSEESPMAKWSDMTGGNLTTMENPIYVMKVDDPSVGQSAEQKQNVLLISGINGRDHHAVTSAMYVLYQLIERSETHKDLLRKYRFWIIPVFNPDGYDYSMTFPQRREWVKNLHQSWEPCKGRESCQYCSSHGIRCTVAPCYGVNLDRNFEYQWIPPQERLAEHPCGNLYAGARQMSEAETQALNNYVHTQQLTISVFIAFKESNVLGVLYPYSHTKKRRAFDEIYRQRARLAAEAAASITDRKYIAGQNSEFLPLYAGGIEDWADGHLGIDNTYSIMMFRPSDLANTKYLTEKVIHEAYAAMDSLLLSNFPTRSQPIALTSETSSLHPSVFAILFASFASYLFR